MDSYKFEVRCRDIIEYSISNVKLQQASDAWIMLQSLAKQYDGPDTLIRVTDKNGHVIISSGVEPVKHARQSLTAG